MFTENWVTQNGGHESHGKGKSEQMQPENSQLTLPRRHNTGPTSLHIMVSTYHKFTYILKLKQWLRAPLNTAVGSYTCISPTDIGFEHSQSVHTKGRLVPVAWKSRSIRSHLKFISSVMWAKNTLHLYII